MNQYDYVVNNTPMLIAAFIIIVGAIWGIWYLMKTNPDKNLGEIAADIAINQKETVFLAFTIGINLTEAIMAASIHPVGQMPPNVIARMSSHLMISFIAIASAIYFQHAASSALVSITKWRKEGTSKVQPVETGILLFKSSILGFCMILFPFINLMLIASGLQQWDNIKLFGYSMSPFISSGELQAINIYYNKPWNYSAFQGIDYVVQISLALMLCHFAGMFGHGASRGISKKGYNPDLHKNISDRGEESNKNKFVTAIESLLKRYGYNKGSDLDDMLDACKVKLDGISVPATRNKIATAAVVLVDKIKAYDADKKANKFSPDEIKKLNSSYKQEIFTFFQGSINAGKGLGQTLKKKGSGN